MNFTTIDLTKWPRGQIFYYFTQMAPTGYSLTVNMDITKLHAAIQKRNIKFFPVYLWLVTKNLNQQTEFKVAKKDGVLGYYDELTPLYASFHEDDHTFSLMWTPYNNDFNEFYETYLNNQRQFGDNHGVLAQPQTPPPANAYTVSCVPWISFEHFAIHSDQKQDYFFPTVEAGRFFERDGQMLLPLSLTVHHATTDGYHVNCFFEMLQKDMDEFI